MNLFHLQRCKVQWKLSNSDKAIKLLTVDIVVESQTPISALLSVQPPGHLEN